MHSEQLKEDIHNSVKAALAEDIGSGDITAALVDADTQYKVHVISREDAIICGTQWVNETFNQVDAGVNIQWQTSDGNAVTENQILFSAEGSARAILTAERTALNFLQLLSGTATLCRQYANAVSDTQAKVLDTRKTIPGLRTAQKYAVHCGGCHNHRIGLYDAYLIKENHIAACGSIAQAIEKARVQQGNKPVEVEVESLTELEQALDAGADIIMLDNFSLEHMRQAVARSKGKAKLEASGNVSLATIKAIAQTGVDYISIGALTKHVNAIDLSMRFV
jgi:nicotinate-nucleotide pyrophosphorylase (carboxylating)